MSGSEPDSASEDQLSKPILEPVCFSSSIQPYGVLLTFSDPELIVLRVSANTQDYLGVPPQNLLNQPLGILLNAATVEAIRQALELANGESFSKLSIYTWIGDQCFAGTVYRAAATIILELEPAPTSREAHPFQAHTRVKQAIIQLRQVPDLSEFLQSAATEVRHITGFNRVMVYQFDSQGTGTVVAETKQDGLPAYLGLHYPATDIPEPVRALYQQGLVRYIPDLGARSVGLIPAENVMTQPPLDLSFSGLRSVDPCCVEYHQNMGVAAMLVVALIQGKTLWGLISCHHHTPKSVSYDVRESCELLGQLIASELANKVNIEELNYLTKLRSLQSEFVQSIAQADDLKQALINPAPRLLDLVSAQGVAVCLENEITLIGKTPSLEQVHALIQWTETQGDILSLPTQSSFPDKALFYTDSLPKLYPEAAMFKDYASGLLMLQISKVRRYTILWFRPEVLQTVKWAGDPSTSLTVAADGSVRLCPRKSFEQWQEIVQFTSLPWKACELENALDIKGAIVGIVLKKADELARVNQELERSIQELDSFAYAASHDLKEPLRGIHNYSNLLLKGYSEVLNDAGRARLQTLMRLTRRMEALIDALLTFSRLGRADLHLQPTNLNRTVRQVLEDLHISYPDLQAKIRIPRPLPTVNCDPVLIQDVLINLISNAIKYNDKSEQWVEIGYTEQALEAKVENLEESKLQTSNSRTFYIRDNGIGIRERHLNSIFQLFKRLHEQHLYGGGTGAGLTIAKKIIERHGGQIWVESTYNEGSTFYFTLK